MTTPAAERCPTCDRKIADAWEINEGHCEVAVSFTSRSRRSGEWNLRANKDCAAHRVDWRARALAAEAERSAILALVSPSSDQSLPDAVRELCEQVDDARQWRAALEGVEEPGDPVIRALAALLTCTYLDRLPTPADDDIRRELVVAARIAHDKTRADAAKWAKVAPLIERLRRKCDADDLERAAVCNASQVAAIECAGAILATTEPKP